MIRALVLFNHTLTDAQQQELVQCFGCDQVVYPPDDVQSQWGNIHPARELPNHQTNRVVRWLQAAGKPEDVLVVQGDHGATCYVVSFALQNGLVPLYATTERITTEETCTDGTVRRTAHFKHVRFRRYRFWEEF